MEKHEGLIGHKWSESWYSRKQNIRTVGTRGNAYLKTSKVYDGNKAIFGGDAPLFEDPFGEPLP